MDVKCEVKLVWRFDFGHSCGFTEMSVLGMNTRGLIWYLEWFVIVVGDYMVQKLKTDCDVSLSWMVFRTAH